MARGRGSEKGTSKQRPKRSEGASFVGIPWKDILGREDSRSRGPKSGTPGQTRVENVQTARQPGVRRWGFIHRLTESPGGLRAGEWGHQAPGPPRRGSTGLEWVVEGPGRDGQPRWRLVHLARGRQMG